MTPERWQQVERLLETVLAQPPTARGEWLARACDGDDALRQEVESLLRHHQEDDFLAALPAALAAEVVATQAELSGQPFGPYQVERPLGQGGMGVVYLARDTRLGRLVALKLLQAQFTQDAERMRRFQQEARAASSLNHPNILTIYEVGQAPAVEGSAHFIAAEFVAGETLRARLRRGVLLPEEALDCASQMAAALAAAHQAGIIHRDIKPENVMLRPDGFVKVLDFGLAKLTEASAQDWDIFRTGDGESGRRGEGEKGRVGEGESGGVGVGKNVTPSPPHPLSPFRSWATRPGSVMGTVAYMSPEQARGLEVDARSDLFSLGIVFYEMLTGARPFSGETPMDVLAALIEREPPPLPPGLLSEAAEADAHAELQQIVSRALAKPLDRRYQTANELLDDLKRLRRELEFTAKLRGEVAAQETKARAGARQAALEDQPTVIGEQAAALPVVEPGWLFGYLQRHPRQVAGVLLFLLLLTAKLVLPAHWLAWDFTERNSVAVLPFVNAGNDAQMVYLSDGITESLMGNLSQLPGLRVVSRNTVFTYKGREIDPRQVGADLNVRAVVTGRVLRQGEQLLIRATLIDTANGAHLWDREYSRPLAELPTVEREITHEISAALRLRLRGDEQQQLANRQSANSEAYQLYLKGNYLYLQGSREAQQKALDYYNQATALDPRYALAHAGIATIYAIFSGQYLPPNQAMPKAREAARQAVTLDERLPEAHLALARVKLWGDWDWVGAEQECQRASELNPNFTEAIVFHAGLLWTIKRFEQSLSEARRAEALDLLAPSAVIVVCGVFYFSRQYDRLIEESRKALDLNPTGFYASYLHRYLGCAFLQKQRPEEAIAELLQAVSLSRSAATLSWLGYGYAVTGRKTEALKILHELEGEATHRYVSPVSIAKIYIGLGDKEQALAWLRKSYEAHSDQVLALGVEPIYDPLRTDPRFIEMLRGIGLEP